MTVETMKTYLFLQKRQRSLLISSTHFKLLKEKRVIESTVRWKTIFDQIDIKKARKALWFFIPTQLFIHGQ